MSEENVEHEKSFTQRLFTGLMPWWAADMEKESREWLLVCPNCGHERSYWEIGGIRWKAKSRGKYIGSTCSACGKTGMHKVIHRPSQPGKPSRSGD
jgi:hypothetical protein